MCFFNWEILHNGGRKKRDSSEARRGKK